VDAALWIAVAILLVVLVALQVAGTRALRRLGVEPSRGVLALRIVNTVIVIAAVAWMFWVWVR
jgi:hypothetical protein